MAKFASDEVDKTTEENQEALEDLGLTIELVDRTTGEKHILNDENASAIRFKERKNKLFIRIKGDSGVLISIPERLLPKFIKVETKKREIW
jgi:hypothetical protein